MASCSASAGDWSVRVLDGIDCVTTSTGPMRGIAAIDVLVTDWEVPRPQHELAERSERAIDLAARLRFDTPADTARWLYAFGTLQPPGVERGMATPWTFRAALDRHFVRSSRPGWQVWSRPERPTTSPPLHKLYISPRRFDEEWLEALTAALGEGGPAAIKMSTQHAEPGRPDKLVFYFDSPYDRSTWLNTFEPPCGRAHGVPFTDQAAATPLLSVATDPDPRELTVESWRSQCTGVMARMLTAPFDGDPATVRRAVGWRLRLAGIDVGRWTAIGGPRDC